MEEWQRNGIWLISRSDEDYPSHYKRHFKDKAPPLLYGAGDRSLLTGGGLAIVGSRKVDGKVEDFTRRTAAVCALAGMRIVSGGARGIDQYAMGSALEAGGKVIGILADKLLKKSVEKSARYAIADGRLLLLSPYHPDAHFTVGTAMGRNKLIYAMADYGLVVNAEFEKGGTWNGAVEELKRPVSRPVFVRDGDDVPLGNKKLLEMGAMPWPMDIESADLYQTLKDLADAGSEPSGEINLNLFDDQTMRDTTKYKDRTRAEPDKKGSSNSIYEAVLPLLLHSLEGPATIEEIAASLDVLETQLESWLEKAVAEKKVTRLSRPVRYQRIPKSA
jgi:predicted Rossmann fold nucleotide-binding protein DprA/Smf involved in DNA uptake